MASEKTVTIPQALQAAVQHVQAGQLQKAGQICSQIIKVAPDNAEAHHLLGVIALQAEKNDLAIELISRATKINPHAAAYCINLGNALRAQGRLDAAIESYQRALRLKPDNALAHNNLGATLKAQGKPDEAIQSFRQALQNKPDYAEAHYNLGNSLAEQNRPDEAVESFNLAVGIMPGYAEAHYNLGLVLMGQNKLPEAEKSIRQALHLKPGPAEAYNNLGLVLQQQDKTDEAIESYNQAITIKPDYAEPYYNLGRALNNKAKPAEAAAMFEQALHINPDFALAHHNLGNALQDLGKLDEAAALYGQALRIDPDFAQAHNNLGNVLKSQGKLDEAATSYRRALERQADFAEAHRQLAHAKKHSEYDNEIKSMELLLEDRNLIDDQKMNLNFGLGKAFEDLGQYEKSFHFILEANRLKRETFDYDISEDRIFINNIKKTFDERFIHQHSHSGWAGDTPIFIVGMPRSGTTLVEQILSAHPQVFGAGELRYMKTMIMDSCSNMEGLEYPECFAGFSENGFKEFGKAYINELRQISKEAEYITDKMPHNFLNIGLIKLSLPGAKIIHCQRNPMDTCWSIFKNFFAGIHNYAYNLRELGEYYKLYERLMEHWRTILPGLLFEIQYEELVADQENQTRRLLEYCGLDWQDDCLSFHKSSRPVRTASSTQVRQTIYNDSVLLWKHYEKELQPLLQALDYAE